MDSNCRNSKRRGGGGFIKGKLRSLYRASSIKVKPSRSRSPSPPATDQGGRMAMMNQQKSNMNMITATQYYNNKVPTTTTSTASSSVGTLIVNQDHHLPKHITTTTGGGVDSYNAAGMDALYGGLQVDETVDLKAANYISSVLERFRLEHLN